MDMEMRQYWVGKVLYHAIDCTKWRPKGDVLRMNPTNKMIDQFFDKLRSALKRLERDGHLKRSGRKYTPVASQLHDSWLALPMYGKRGYTFRLSDLIQARAIMKRLKPMFEKFKDWNDINWLVKALRNRRVPKPALMANLIFAAWTFQREV